jgi:hypothetical protein
MPAVHCVGDSTAVWAEWASFGLEIAAVPTLHAFGIFLIIGMQEQPL